MRTGKAKVSGWASSERGNKVGRCTILPFGAACAGDAGAGISRHGFLTKRMTAAKLRLLCVACLQLVADAIEKLNIALLRILFEGSDKGPRHGASGLRSNGCIGTRRVRLLACRGGKVTGRKHKAAQC